MRVFRKSGEEITLNHEHASSYQETLGQDAAGLVSAATVSGGTVQTNGSFSAYVGTNGNDGLDVTDIGTVYPQVSEVRGLAGDDIIYGPKDTSINIVAQNGPGEHDIISYEKFTTSVFLSPSTTLISGQKSGYLLAEQLRGSEQADIMLFGSSSPIHIIDGAGGDDIIVSANGVDQIVYGGGGNDAITAGGRSHSYADGGSGTNTLNINAYPVPTVGATITLNGAGGGNASYDDGLGYTLAFANFQTINGTRLADTIIGSAGNDIAGGGVGNDLFQGSAGHDLLYGGSLLNGERNTLTYASSGQALLFDLTQGPDKGTVTDQASSGVNLTTSYFSFTDFIGTSVSDYFNVNPNSTIHADGRGGGDYLNFSGYTGGGIDLRLGAQSSAGFYENFATVYGTGANDAIVGDAKANNLFGGKGDDVLSGGGGDDVINGGLGNDTMTFSDFTTGITLNLTSYFPSVLDPNHQYYPVAFEGLGHDGFYTYQDANGGTYVSTFFNMETYIGSIFDDRLFGGWSNDTIDGGAGSDYFRGGIGDDVLTGGIGNDIIFAGPGTDNVYGGENNDYLTGGSSGDDFLYGGNGDDVIEEYSGQNTLTGGAGHDTFVFDTLIRAASQPTFFGYNEVHDTLNLITDFHVGNTTTDTNADILDLSPLLTNLFYQATSLTAIDPALLSSTSATNITDFDYAADPNGTTLGQYVRVVQVNGTGDYHLQVNVDAATGFSKYQGLAGDWTDVAVLQGTAGTTLTLDQLLANHEILFAPHQQQSQAHGGTLAEYPYVVGDPTLAPYFHPTFPVPNHG
ncbi:MAG TPA: calcium-binding protein [Dongiaceae bacterium]|jgi:Ca2+-binding RTX toxin-like protein|nr:calcium-binding protein [Dongiaceae bacterium]